MNTLNAEVKSLGLDKIRGEKRHRVRPKSSKRKYRCVFFFFFFFFLLIFFYILTFLSTL